MASGTYDPTQAYGSGSGDTPRQFPSTYWTPLATAKAHHYANEDLIPGIPINTDAMARRTQLVQQGFVKITEQ